MLTPVKWADDTARHIAENVGQQMENEAKEDAVYPTEQLRWFKERAMTAIGRQPGSYDVSKEMTDFSHKTADSAGKITGTGHSEV